MPTDPRVQAIRLGEFGIPERFRKVTLDYLGWLPAESSLVKDLDQRLVTGHRNLDAYPADWTSIGRGIAYVGPPGTGKTTHGIATLLEIYQRYGLPVLFIPYPEYIDRLKEGWNASSREQSQEIRAMVNRVRTYPVVMLDNVGHEDTRAGKKERFGAETLDQVLRHRHSTGRPTIITTNTPRPEWPERYGDAIASFAGEAFDWVPMTGRDRRAQG